MWSSDAHGESVVIGSKQLSMASSHGKAIHRESNVADSKNTTINTNNFTPVNDSIAPKPAACKQTVIIRALQTVNGSRLYQHNGECNHTHLETEH